MLKSSSEQDVNVFTAKVINFFNPKFETETEVELARADIFKFALRCELTAEEFLLALNLATEGKLKSEINGEGGAEVIKLYRDIDSIKLGEVKAAYMRYKIEDEKYKKGKDQIRNYLNPPPPKMTSEEYEALTLENIKRDYHRFKADGKVLATPLFYDLIKQARGENIKLKFVESFLKNFVPEVAEGKLSATGTALPKLIKKDAYLEFQNEMIVNYVLYLKLHETSEEVWMQHWKRLINKKKENEKHD